MSRTYHDAVRRDAAALLPGPVGRVLEVGCGNGGTLGLLKQLGLCRWAGGVERMPSAAEAAAKVADRVWQTDVETLVDSFGDDLTPGSLDAVLCLDVLEHLVDPWTVTTRLASLLRPGGVLIASLPNIRHYTVLRDLALHGRWEYREAGILDRTHLRFFTREGALSLIATAGLRVDRVNPLLSVKRLQLKWCLHRLAPGLLEPFLATQYLIRGVRAAIR